MRFGRYGRNGCYIPGNKFWDQGSILNFLDKTSPDPSIPMVSHCNKASKSKAIEGVQTDGYFVSAFQGPRKQHDECRNKTANFYLPFEKQLDHGQVVVNFVGALKSNFFNNLSSGLSAFKFYGLPDSGGNLMKEA